MIMNQFDIRGEVNVQTLPISIGQKPIGASCQALRIGGRPVPEDAFYRIPCEPIDGTPFGWVNLPLNEDDAMQEGRALHVVWLNRDGDARRAFVPAEPPPGADAAAWAKRYAELKALPHLFVGV
jgi:hypothetical protein